MKIGRFKIVAVVLCLALGVSSLVACVQKPEETPFTPQSELRDGFTPIPSEERLDYELEALYSSYEESAKAIFEIDEAEESELILEDCEGGLRLVKYVGESDKVAIPQEINGKKIVEIAKGALSECDTLEALSLPLCNSGEENGFLGYLFGCDEYAKNPVTVPPSLKLVNITDATVIPENYFAGCKTIEYIILPESVEAVENFAFYECSSLVGIELGGTREIGQYAFGYCTSLFKIELDRAEQIGKGALYRCDSLFFLTVSFIGKSETENRFIGHIFGAESADHNDEFMPRSLSNVVLTNCIDIPDRAFAGCKYISNVVMEEGVTNIGVRAFYGCRSIMSIELPDSVKAIGDDAFFGCDNLLSVKLGEGLESVGMQAFYGCLKLENINLPDSLTEIKQSTFAFCESLTEIDLKNVKTVRKDAFFGCDLEVYPDISGVLIIEDGNLAIVKPEMDTTEAVK